jgi:hypothetical protein
MDILFIITIYVIFTILITVAVIYKIINYKEPPKDYAPNMLKLASENLVATSYEVKEQLLLPGSSSLILFLNLQPGDKTADIKGYMTPLLNIAGIMLFEISPVPRKISRDFTKSDNTLNTTAQIRVGTYGENGFEIEQITIPDLPLQKWICLGILREGRRIDVVYDNRIVASKRLNNNLPSQPYGGLTIAKQNNGKTGLLGSVQHVFMLPYRLNIKDFSAFRNNYIKPDGELVTKIDIPIPFYNIGIPIMNLSTTDVSSPPSNTLQKWYTPYQ